MLAQKFGSSLSDGLLFLIKFKYIDLIFEKLKSALGILICFGRYFKWPFLSALLKKK